MILNCSRFDGKNHIWDQMRQNQNFSMQGRVFYIYLVVLIFLPQLLKSQALIDTSGIVSRPEALQEVFYLHFPDYHSKKIQGRIYHNPYTNIPDHQFFRSSFPSEGIVYTSDDTIHCSYLLYDISRDKLIVYIRSLKAYIELEEEFIRYFIIRDRDSNEQFLFINTESPNDTLGIPGTDLYQVLFNVEKLGLYKKHIKSLNEVFEGYKLVVRFDK